MAERAYFHAERLVSATYLITKHIDHEEPIRHSLRESTILILDSILNMRDALRTVGADSVSKVESEIRRTISMIRILAVSGFVSFENADILSDAFDELGSFIENARRSTLSESIHLSREELSDVRYGSNTNYSTPSIKDIIKDTNSTKDEVSVMSNSVPYTPPKPQSKGNRSEAIFAILKEQGLSGIKDIAIHIPEYSEKMIQRELFNLVSQGLVVKSGSKRWSTYSVK
ncbi:MAG: seg [Candidatus Kaiserbacteria bacterium]|nr:seg [Candidatus Kaiserbacteria bacterium]